ncbi:hypothetical protein LWI28_007245 [Acer negundo]|uniref:Agenet-like domain-containing protein n=1 Tax=Acer negundo TaxID=4023 RepID=A0AAD5J3F1_ACENE|nr:hypothetical protein LWI28_007245 [Acer negundo]
MTKVGVNSKVLSNSRYIVYFTESYEEVEFEHSDLRLHQDWIDGKWIVAFRGLKSSLVKRKRERGSRIQFEPAGEDKYLAEYESLRTDDDKEFLREEVDTLHIRPHPPQTKMVDSFNWLDKVDAACNDRWWVGVI